MTEILVGATRRQLLRCDMLRSCEQPVTHIDNRGYVYCQAHGLARRAACPCRQLRASERRRLERGEPVRY